MSAELTILAIGDVVGKPGRDILLQKLAGLRDIHRADIIIVNGENAAGGRSITPDIAYDFFNAGVDVITTGNHVWDNNDVLKIIDAEPRLLRPANFPPGSPGRGYRMLQVKGIGVAVVNIQGRGLMQAIDCPFRSFDAIYEEVKEEAPVVVVDFHAETTSEKQALGWYASGRASLVYGTHTHVQTADEKILDGYTGYITDIGMTGAFDSVIGIKKELSIKRFLTQRKVSYEVAEGAPGLNGIAAVFNGTGSAVSIKRIMV